MATWFKEMLENILDTDTKTSSCTDLWKGSTGNLRRHFHDIKFVAAESGKG